MFWTLEVEKGNLVVLSRRGECLKKNHMLVGGFGIVMEVFDMGFYYDVRVRWTCREGHVRNRTTYLKRYELKYLKVKRSKTWN